MVEGEVWKAEDRWSVGRSEGFEERRGRDGRDQGELGSNPTRPLAAEWTISLTSWIDRGWVSDMSTV